MALRKHFPGVLLDVGDAKDYVAKIDAKMRRVKETYRSVKAGLVWKLPLAHVGDLVAYCVSRLNLRQTSALDGVQCLTYLFTGVRPVFRRCLAWLLGIT